MEASAVTVVVQTVAKDLGYDIRARQLQIVMSFMKGQDVFVSLPTGGGKSLCYWILPRVFDKLRKHAVPTCMIVVVSPLIALIKDQVKSLTKKGLQSVNMGEVGEDDYSLQDQIYEGQYQILYFSPECLLKNKKWRDMLLTSWYQENMIGFIVDEAHCVKKWGVTFRKEFGQLGEIRSLLGKGVNIMALTATATKSSRSSICRTLGMNRPTIFSSLPNKPNIKYMVHAKSSSVEESFLELVDDVRRLRTAYDRTIVFCRSYNDCTHIFIFMKKSLAKEYTEPVGAPDLAEFRLVDMFNACTLPTIKNSIIQQFTDPDSCLRVVVATTAFGMGLDCPNVRRVVHWGVPEDIESYLQESGRAGRDDKPALAILYYGRTDMTSVNIKEEMKEYCKLKKCRRNFLLHDFDGNDEIDKSVVTDCSCCDICSVSCMCVACEDRKKSLY